MTQKTSRYWLHRLFVFTDVIARIPAPILVLIVAALSISAAQTWINTTHVVVMGYVAGIGLAVFIAGDWAMLAWLPRRGRSFGPVGMALLALAVVRWALTLATAFIPNTPEWILALVAIGNLALTGNVLDSLWAVRSMRLSLGALLLASILYIFILHGPGGYAFDSAPRHLMTVTPIYLALSLWVNRIAPRYRWIIVAISTLWLGVLAAWFTSGRWVS